MSDDNRPARWLISVSYSDVEHYADGWWQIVGPKRERTMLIDEHPAKFVLAHRAAEEEAVRAGVDQLGETLHAIYSMIEVRDGLLTEDEIRSLSFPNTPRSQP